MHGARHVRGFRNFRLVTVVGRTSGQTQRQRVGRFVRSSFALAISLGRPSSKCAHVQSSNTQFFGLTCVGPVWKFVFKTRTTKAHMHVQIWLWILDDS
ncbi:hypothetical protein MRX96_027611 [Rhipicephalus microplus]